MGPTITSDLTSAGRAAYDLIIDVRSPAEFAEDHVPGAINLPVLDDEERARVGETYVQVSRFKARRLGAALVARNIARHLETVLADREGSFRPLVYCWRGGMRSNAMAHILTQVGWRTAVLEGGYRTWRRHVTARLYDAGPSHRFVVLDGETGSGKTEVLRRLEARGAQVLDLEALADHRGSLLGGFPGRDQPSQKMFESRLLARLETLDPMQWVLVEAESSKVGERMIPPAVWAAMAKAPAIVLTADPAGRAAYLAGAYADVAAEPDYALSRLSRLPFGPSARRLAEWRTWIAGGETERLARALIDLHYDPAYRSARRKSARAVHAAIALDPAEGSGIEAAARAVEAAMAEL